MKKTKIESDQKRSLDSDAMWGPERRFSIIIIPLLMLIIIALSVSTGWFAMQDKTKKQEISDLKSQLEDSERELRSINEEMEEKISDMKKEIEEKNKEAEEAAKKASENDKGFIEGSLGYPSSYIPQDMKICAENLETQEEYCTTNQIYDSKYTYRVGYKIEVPVGSYNVYSSVPAQKDYKAYYSNFVTCGLGYNCPSHDPIKVIVEKDKITEEIDPVDWYKK